MSSKLKKLLLTRRTLIIGIIFILIFFFIIKPIIFPAKTTTSSTTVKKGTIKQELTLSGKIDADEKAQLRFQSGGLLSYVGVKEGDFVKQYQPIASLDQRSVKKYLQRYLNTYSKTRNDFDQTKENYKDGVITDAMKRILDKSQQDLNNSVIDVELQDLSLQLSTITSPIDGIVTKVSTPNPGVNIGITDTPFEIVNPATMYFNVNADQTEITHLSEGQIGTIVFDSYPDEKVSASIRSISFTPKTDESGTVYSVKVNFADSGISSEKFRIGMTGDMTFTIKEKLRVFYLPLQYIKSDDTGKYVLLTTDKSKKTYIKTGLESDTDAEILSGLSENQVVYE